MSRTADEIFRLFTERRARLDPMHASAMEVRNAYYGEVYLPVPEIDGGDKPLVANLLFSAGEQTSMRVASTMPNLFYPSADPGKKSYDQRARFRKQVNLWWYDQVRMKLLMRKRARFMTYYADSPVMIRPHFKDKRPMWQVRNPIGTLPPEMDTGQVRPEDIIFTYPQSFAWVNARYPEALRQFGEPQDIQDGVFTILEYQDTDDQVMCLVGTKVNRNSAWPAYNQNVTRVEQLVEVERVPNRVGQCTAVLAGGIGLEQARGRYDGTIGLWQAMGQLMALTAIGMKRSVWPETWLVDDPNSAGARIIDHADPLHGIVGRVTGGKMQTVEPNPNVLTTQIIDRLERYVRIDAGIPAELGGESTSNIRTGRRGDQILSSVLDFPLQEMQEILAVSMQEENKVAIAIDKAYFPTSKTVVLTGSAGEYTYEANDLWENDTNFVAYSHAGVDAQGLVVELGQLVGTGMISKRSAMETHPLIEDPETEFERMTIEHMRDAMLNGLGQIAQDPNMIRVIADVTKKLKLSEIEVEDAVTMVADEIAQMQQQQMAQQQAAQPGQPAAAPGGPPGLAPAPAIAPPAQSLSNLTQLLRQLHTGQAVGQVPIAQGMPG